MTNTSLRFFAVLVGLLSINRIFAGVTGDGFVDSWTAAFDGSPVLSAMTLLCAIVGIYTASRLWVAHRHSFVTYIAWALLYDVVFLVNDARHEPEFSKLLAGFIPALLVTVYGAIFVRRRIPTSSQMLDT